MPETQMGQFRPRSIDPPEGEKSVDGSLYSSGLMESAREETRERVVRDVSEVQDLVLDTLIDVARNDSSGSARVSAARTLKEYMDESESRANTAQNDLMADKSGEIKAILEHIRREKTGTADSGSTGFLADSSE